MTSEREAEIRKESAVRADDCGRYARDLLTALDAARAERDELRGKVATFKRMAQAGIVRMVERSNTMEGDDQLASAAMAQAVSTMLYEGRELGLWDHGCRCPAPDRTRSDCPAHGDLQATMDDPAAGEGE